MLSSPARGAAQAQPKRQPRPHATPLLHAGMACDTAFRLIARSCFEDLRANHAATSRGGRAALHDMRVALTRLRAAISVFSPMAVDSECIRLKRELKWLNGRLGDARDMDVAIERLADTRKRQPDATANIRSWEKKCADKHRQLARALGSERYRRLIKSTANWLDNGSWSTKTDKRAAKRRAAAVIDYCTRKLARWHEKLLNKSRRLEDMSAKKRHRLRLANKRLRYSIEFFAGLLADRNSAIEATLKHLRKAQESLGELNDAFKIQTMAPTRERNASTRGESPRFRDRKRERRLLRRAGRAYRKMAALKPSWA
jgi:CHAD domain-containing protein